MNFRITKVELYGGDKKCPGRHDAGARNGNYITADSPELAVLNMADNKDGTFSGECYDVEGTVNGTYQYIGRFRCQKPEGADVYDIYKLPPTPSILAHGHRVPLETIVGVLEGYEDAPKVDLVTPAA